MSDPNLSGTVTASGASAPNRPDGAAADPNIRAIPPLGRVPRYGGHAALRPRVLLRGDVLFEPPRDPPQAAADLTHGWDVAADEEPAGRVCKIGPDWSPLLRPIASLIEGWDDLGGPSLVYIENLHGLDRHVRPSADELADDAAHVIEVGRAAADGTVVPVALVRPSRGLALEPAGELTARCRAGACRSRVVALPPNADAPRLPPEAEG